MTTEFVWAHLIYDNNGEKEDVVYIIHTRHGFDTIDLNPDDELLDEGKFELLTSEFEDDVAVAKLEAMFPDSWVTFAC